MNPETGESMTFGTSFEALRKSWFGYKRSRKDGFPAPDLALRILKIQKALSLPLSEYFELSQNIGGVTIPNIFRLGNVSIKHQVSQAAEMAIQYLDLNYFQNWKTTPDEESKGIMNR